MSQYQSKGGRRDAQHKKPGKFAGSAGNRKGASLVSGKGGVAEGTGPSNRTPHTFNIVSGAAAPPTSSLPPVTSTIKTDKEANGAATFSRGTAVKTSTDVNQTQVPSISQKHLSQKQSEVEISSSSADPGIIEPAFTFQFGSITPGFIQRTGIQIPARTSSAPPKFDEDNRKQAVYEESYTPLVETDDNHAVAHGASSFDVQRDAQTQVPTQDTKAQCPTFLDMQLSKPEGSSLQLFNSYCDDKLPQDVKKEISSCHSNHMTTPMSNKSKPTNHDGSYEDLSSAANDSSVPAISLSQDKLPLAANVEMKITSVDGAALAPVSSAFIPSTVVGRELSKSQIGASPGSDVKNGSNFSQSEKGLPAVQLTSVESLETAFQGLENLSITTEEKLLTESGRIGSSIHLDHFSKGSSADNALSLDHSLLQKDEMSQEACVKFHSEVICDTDKLPDESGPFSTSACFILQENVNPFSVHSSGSVLREDDLSINNYSRTSTLDENFAHPISTGSNLALASDLMVDVKRDYEVEDTFDLAQVSRLANDISGTLHTLDPINMELTQIETLSDPREDHLSLKVSLGLVTAMNLSVPDEKLTSVSVMQDSGLHGKLGHKQVKEHGSKSLNSNRVHSISDVLPANNYLDAGNTAPIVSSIHNGESQCSPDQTGSTFVDQPPLISNSSDIVKEAKQGSKRKKKKELLAKADAAGSTADLYNAYKAPEARRRDEEKPTEECGTVSEKGKLTSDDRKLFKNNSSTELDDWEDAAELPASTPTFITCKETSSKQRLNEKNHMCNMNKYTRDFLLTFRDNSHELPSDFPPSFGGYILTPEASAFLTARETARETSLSLDRSLEHQSSTAVIHERRGSVGDDDRWAKVLGFSSTSDVRGDMRSAAPYNAFWPGPNANIGLTARNLLGIRPGMPVLPIMMPGDIPGAPSTHMAVGPFPRPGGVDADRWQRASASQKGLIPFPQTPSPAIHKAEKRYEVGKVSDEEELKQRQIKAILNKLTPQNFDRLFEQVKEVKIETAATLTGVISQIFDKALMEPTFCEMYAKFCAQLALKLPEFNENGERVTFRRVLLNKCQEEFEQGVKEQEEAEMEEEGEIPLTKEEKEAKKLKARRRMLGNIRFIGELYKMSMLTERIMHECIKKLLGEYQNPEEEDIEALCKLMATIGLIIDHPKAKAHLDAYFDRMNDLSNNKKLSSRLRFMLKDVIDLRRNGWQERRKVEGPKKIDEVHREAAQERQSVSVRDRMARLPSIGGYARRPESSNDYFLRGNPPFLTMPTGAAPPFATRGGTVHVPIYGQDFRMDDRSVMESKTLPFPSMQRLNEDVIVTLVPQGGLGKNFGVRTQPPAATARSALADVPAIILGDSRHAGIGPIHPVTDRRFYGVRHHEEIPLRPLSSDRMHGSAERPLLEKTYMSDRYGSSYGSDMRGIERNIPDRSMGTLASRPGTAPSAIYAHSATLSPQVLSEDQMIKRCRATIREYYSIRNLKEAVQFVDELKAPQFHPKMVSIWISDSLEKKESDRDLLVTLLIRLRQMDQPLLTHEQLFQGFQEVLFLLEDTKVDVPKAPSYLAGIMGKLLAESVVSLKEVRKLLMEGGLEHGSLLETGDALIMLADVLDILRKEQGNTFMVRTYTESGLALEEFLGRRNRPEKLHALLESKNLQVLYTRPL